MQWEVNAILVVSRGAVGSDPWVDLIFSFCPVVTPFAAMALWVARRKHPVASLLWVPHRGRALGTACHQGDWMASMPGLDLATVRWNSPVTHLRHHC